MRKYFITTARLGLSHWQPADEPLALALWGDPAVSRYISVNGFTDEQVRARLATEIENSEKHSVQYWPVFLKDTGEHIGCCGLRLLDVPPDTIGFGGYELGFHLRSAYWGKGYATEAARAVIAYAFGTLGLDCIYAGHHPANAASAALLGKLGFIYLADMLYPPTGLKHPVYCIKSDNT